MPDTNRCQLEARYYQSQAVTRLHDLIVTQGHREVGLYFVMGAGKTLTSLALIPQVSDPLRGNFLIATPQDSISDGWTRDGGKSILLDAGEEYERAVKLPIVVRHKDCETVRIQIEYHLEASGQLGLVVNYGALADFVASQSPERLTHLASGRILVCDEGHHTWKGFQKRADGEGAPDIDDSSWGSLRTKWLAAGGILLVATATPWSDPTGKDDDYSIPYVERTFSDQMRDGHAPRNLRFSSIHDPTFEGRIHQLRARWESSGRPGLVVRAESTGDSVRNRSLVSSLIEAFSSSGVGVVNAYGPEGKFALSQALNTYETLREEARAENRKVSFLDPRLPRVFVTMSRMGEGTDVPWVSCVAFVGLPSSALAFDQLFGRGLRCKYDQGEPIFEDYPEDWLQQSQAFFLTQEDRDNDLLCAALCQRLVSYRNACMLLEGPLPEGAAAKPPAKGKSSLEVAQEVEVERHLRNICEGLIGEAKAFLESLPEESSYDEGNLRRLAKNLLERQLERSPGHGYTPEAIQHAFQTLLANPKFAEVERPVDRMGLDPSVIQAFVDNTWVSLRERRATVEAVDAVGEMAHGWEPSSEEGVLAALKSYLEERKVLPTSQEFRAEHRMESRFLLRQGTSLGQFAVKHLGSREHWLDVVQRAELAHRLGAADLGDIPEVFYFSGARRLAHVDLPALREISLEEGHLLGSLSQPHRESLLGLLSLGEVERVRELMYEGAILKNRRGLQESMANVN